MSEERATLAIQFLILGLMLVLAFGSCTFHSRLDRIEEWIRARELQ